MPNEFDQSAFIGVFKVEAEEYLAVLQQGLLDLEKNPAQPAVIDSMFRAAHTLKGCSRMMGFLDIQQVAHHLEDLFGKIKEGQLSLTRDMTDRALAGLDAITGIVEAVTQGKPSTVDVAPICADLEKLAAGKTEATTAPVVEAIPVQSTPTPKVATPVVATAPAAPAAPKAPKPQPAPVPAAPATVPTGRSEEFIRIPVSRVNALFNLIGELVIHKVKSSYKVSNLRNLTHQTKLSQKRLGTLIDQAGIGANVEVLRALQEFQAVAETQKRQVMDLAETLSAEALHLDPVIDELQYKVRELRMLPCSTVFDGFERLVRDIARQEKKDVSLVVEGDETELDKKLLEVMKPCLVHLLRNAVDHGVESPDEREAAGKPRQATIWLRASQQGGAAVIEVQDDGAGIDLQAVRQVALRKHVATAEEIDAMDDAELMNLIFAPGFSTSPIITDISGRGVGMDVVRKEVEQLRGSVSVRSQVGNGTTVTIRLPLTLAIMEILLVESNQQRLGLPMLSIEEIVRVKASEIQSVKGRMAVTLRDRTLPVVRLSDLLGLPAPVVDEDAKKTSPPQDWPVVVASQSERRVGLIVDEVLGEEEIFIKSLPSHLDALRNVNGASILGTGEVIVVLDVQDLITSARQATPTIKPKAAAPADKPKPRILIAEDSLTTREFERSLLEGHGYEVETAVDGLDGLEKLAKGRYHLVVSDVQMPRMDGFEFCRNIRQRPEWAELPLVFVTTLDKDEEKRRGIEVGAQAYIVKGAFDQSSLLETIERLVG